MIISTGLFGGTTELAHPIPRSFLYFWTYFFLDTYYQLKIQYIFIIVYKNEKRKNYFRHIRYNGGHGMHSLAHCDTVACTQ